MARQSAQLKETPDRDRADVQKFLDQMGRAVTSGDGATVAKMWEAPGLVLGDEMSMAVSSTAELARFFGGAKEQYNQRGITDTRAEVVRLYWPTGRIAIVEVRWPYLDAKGAERGSETSTYTLWRNDDGELKMRAAVMHGAAES